MPTAVVAQDTARVELSAVIERALDASPDLAVVRSAVDFAGARLDMASASRIVPTLVSNTAVSIAPGVSNPNGVATDALYLDPQVRNDFSQLAPFAYADINFVQPIYTWGRLGGSIAAASSGRDAAVHAVGDKEELVALRAAELYYNLILVEDLAQLTDRAGDVLDEAKEEIVRLLEEGDPDVDDADRYELLMTEQEFARRVVDVRQQRRTARVALRRQLLLPDSVVVAPGAADLVPIDLPLATLDRYLAAARTRPVLQQVQAGVSAHDALLRSVRAEYYPQIALVGSASISAASGRHRQPNPFISDGFRSARARTGFAISQKLNFSVTRSRVAQAKAQRDGYRHQFEAAEQLVLFETEAAWREVHIKDAALTAQDSSLAITKEWLRVETINFDLGFGDTENLIKAVQANLETEARYLEAVRDYNVAVLRLLAAAGLLTEEMRAGNLRG